MSNRPQRAPARSRPRRRERLRGSVVAALIVVAAFLGLAGCTRGTRAVEDARLLRKIGFNLSAFNAEGLIGPPDGRRALDYEFCIPAGERFGREVRKIDPSLRLQPGSAGRIGCAPGQVLCIGNSHQPRFREILLDLARLDYVERIGETVWE